MAFSIKNDNTTKVLSVLDVAVERVLGGLARHHAEALKESLTLFSVDVTGERSQPGEFPFKDRGALSDNVDWAYDKASRRSRFGVLVTSGLESEGLEPYEYIMRLEDEMGRLGIRESYRRNEIPAEIAVQRSNLFKR